MKTKKVPLILVFVMLVGLFLVVVMQPRVPGTGSFEIESIRLGDGATKVVERFPHGKVYVTKHYQHEIPHGYYERRYYSGAVAEVGHHRYDKKDGVWVIYNRDGGVTITGTYSNGVPISGWFVDPRVKTYNTYSPPKVSAAELRELYDSERQRMKEPNSD